MIQKFNEMEICSNDYMEHQGYGREDVFNEVEMVSDIADFVKVLLKNGQQVRMWCDGMTVCIEYNYLDQSISGVSLEWLGPDEYVETYAKEEDAEE